MSKQIEVGKIVNTRGLKGEVKVYPYVDEPEAFEEFSYLLIDGNKFEIKGRKYFKNMAFISLDGIDTVEKAEMLRNKVCYIYEEDLPMLTEDEYYVKDIIGLEVYTDEGEYKGNVKDVMKTGSNDVYEVSLKGKKPLYLPAIKDVVKEINLDEKKITVHMIDGLDEL